MRIIQKYKSMPLQVKASFWFLICAFLQRGISAITTPIFTRIMSTAEYGQYNVYNSWLSIITCFTTLNIYGGVFTQGIVKYEDERDSFAAAFQGLLFFMALVWIFIYTLIKSVVNPVLDLTSLQGYLMLLIIWLNGVFQLWSQSQRAIFKYKLLVLVTLTYSVLTPCLSILFMHISDDKVTARIIGVACAGIISYTWAFVFQVLKGKTIFSKKIWNYALRLSIPLIPHYLSQMILNSSDRIMIKSMVGASETGIYSLAYSVSLIMTVFNTSLLSTIEPWIYRKIKNKQINDLHKVAYPAFIAIASINLLLIIFAPEIIKIFAPKEYYDAIYVIPPVAMSVYFLFTYSFFALFEFYYERTSYITIATLTGAIINIITNYIFIKLFGYIAAGYTTLGCYIIYTLMHYLFMCKICEEKLEGAHPYNMKIVSTISIAFMVLGLLLMLTYSYPIIRYGIVCVSIIIMVIKVDSIKKLIHKFLDIRNTNKE